MSVERYIQLEDTSGTPLLQTDDFVGLGFTITEGQLGTFRWELPRKHPALNFLRDLTASQDTIWRYYWQDLALGVSERNEFNGLIRKEERRREGKALRYVFNGYDGKDFLRRRHVEYFRGQQYAAWNAKANSVMHGLYNSNLTAKANNEDRWRNGAMPGMQLSHGGPRGLQIVDDYSGDNVLQVLVELYGGTDIAFDVVYVGAGQWQFVTYPDLIGTDKSADLLFRELVVDDPLSNIIDAVYTHDLSQNINSVAAAGTTTAGVEIVQVADNRQSSNAARWARYEGVEMGAGETLQQLKDRAAFALAAAAVEAQLRFTVLQRKGMAYGADYGFGDAVTVSALDETLVQRMRSVSFDVRGNTQQITPTFSTEAHHQINRNLIYLNAKINRLERRLRRGVNE